MSIQNAIQLLQNIHSGITGITSAPNVYVTTWQASTQYVASRVIQPTNPTGYYYQAGGNGTSASSQPTWPTAIGNTVVDNDITWTCISNADPGGWPESITDAKLPIVLVGEGTGGSTRNAGDDVGLRNYQVYIVIDEANEDSYANARNMAPIFLDRFQIAYRDNYVLSDANSRTIIQNATPGNLTDSGFTLFENFYHLGYYGVLLTVTMENVNYDSDY